MKLKDAKHRSDLTVNIGSGKTIKTSISEELSYDKLGRIDGRSINASDYADLNSIAGTSETIYTSDNLGRLIKAADTGNDRTWEYSYDSIGNITSSTYTDEEGVHEETYNYDRDNLTKYNGEKVDGYKGGNPKTYLGNTLTWARGRQLMSVTPAKKRSEYSASDTVIFTYAYDGSRLSKTVGQTKKNSGTTTEYVLNGSTILAQNTTYPDGSKETLNFYYSSDGKLLEIGYLKGDDNGNISKDAVETHYSVIRNAMGDVAAIYTADGTLVGTYEYDPYGRLLSESSNPSYTDTDDILHKNPFRYRGYYYDQETKWYYLQSRYYDPQVKRFINADSTDLLTTDNINLMQYNLFMYCNGNPMNFRDYTGHFGIVGMIAIGAAFGAVTGAISALASGGSVVEGAIEGALTGGIGTACLIFLPEIAPAAACFLCTMVDLGVQMVANEIRGESETIDYWRAVETGAFSALGTTFPSIGNSAREGFTALADSIIWGEMSMGVTFGDMIVDYLWDDFTEY